MTADPGCSIIFIVIVIITVPKPTLTEPLGVEIVRFGQKGAQRAQQVLTKETRGGGAVVTGN